jgi:hypothetical protein
MARMVVQSWMRPPMMTMRHDRNIFSNENSRPMVKSRRRIPISPNASMEAWSVMRPNPNGPASIPMMTNVTMLGILIIWPT